MDIVIMIDNGVNGKRFVQQISAQAYKQALKENPHYLLNIIEQAEQANKPICGGVGNSNGIDQSGFSCYVPMYPILV